MIFSVHTAIWSCPNEEKCPSSIVLQSVYPCGWFTAVNRLPRPLTGRLYGVYMYIGTYLGCYVPRYVYVYVCTRVRRIPPSQARTAKGYTEPNIKPPAGRGFTPRCHAIYGNYLLFSNSQCRQPHLGETNDCLTSGAQESIIIRLWACNPPSLGPVPGSGDLKREAETRPEK